MPLEARIDLKGMLKLYWGDGRRNQEITLKKCGHFCHRNALNSGTRCCKCYGNEPHKWRPVWCDICRAGLAP